MATAGIFCLSVEFVLIQFLGVGSFRDTRPLRRDGSTFCIQRKVHAVKRAEHGYRVVAPQPAMTPNDLLRHTYYPARHMGIATVDKLPSLPVLVASGRARLIRIVIWTATELFFMTIVLFARQKDPTVHVLPNVGFEGPVFVRA